MSLRQLKKLKKMKGIENEEEKVEKEIIKNEANEDKEDKEEDNKKNIFNQLSSSEEELDIPESKKDDLITREETKAELNKDEINKLNSSGNENVKENEKKIEIEKVEVKKINKSKKNKKKKQPNKEEEEKFFEELKASIEEQKKNSEVYEEDVKSPEEESILKIEQWRLNEDREFESLFKDEVSKSSGSDNESHIQMTKKSKRYLEAVKKRMQNNRKTKKKRLLVKIEAEMQIPLITSYEMKIISSSGRDLFSYESSKEFTKLHDQFLIAQKSNDIQRIVNFSGMYPQHPQSLLIISEFLRVKGDFNQAAKFLKKCICLFESSWHFRFNLLSNPPNTHLDLLKNQLNLVFAQSIFRYIDVLGKKGCSQTALEYTKLLLSFEPTQDIFGAFFLIDFYCLRQKNAIYLRKFISNYSKEFLSKPKNSLTLLPNFIYSYSLASKLSIQNDDPFSKWDEILPKILSLESAMQIVSLEPEEILICSIVLYPIIFIKLIESLKLGAMPEFLKSLEKESSTYEYPWICREAANFNRKKGIVEKITDIYLEKGGSCFTNEISKIWLKKVLKEMNSNIFILEECISVRNHIISIADLNYFLDTYEALNIIDFKEEIKTIPAEQLNPYLEQNIFYGGQNNDQVNNLPQNLANVGGNPIWVFLRSMLP